MSVIRRYIESIKRLETAINVIESDLSDKSKLSILSGIKCDGCTFGHVSEVNDMYVCLPMSEVLIKLKDELHSFKHALAFIKQLPTYKH